MAIFSERSLPNPARNEIKGVVCGVRVEEIEEPLMREIRSWISWWMSWPGGKPWKRS